MSRTEYAPLKPWTVAARLIGGCLGLALILCCIGWSIVAFAPQAWLRADLNGNVWIADRRTETFDFLTRIGSGMSDTLTCIVVATVVFFVFRLWLGRWRESWTVAVAIVGELQVFLIVTALVGRDRPTVEQLDLAPPTSSFPSGHTAAAVALYGCIAVIVLRELNPRWLAILIATVCWSIPVIVALSRVYRGMHFPSDVFFGALGGAAWLAITLSTLLVLRRSPTMTTHPPQEKVST